MLRGAQLSSLFFLFVSVGATPAAELPVQGVCNFLLAPQVGLFHPANNHASPGTNTSLVGRAWIQIQELMSLGHVHRGHEGVIDRNRLALPEMIDVVPVKLPARIETSLHGAEAAIRSALEQALAGNQISSFPLKDTMARLHRSMYAEAARQILKQVSPSRLGGRRFLEKLDRELRREDVPLLHDFEAIKHFVELSGGAEPDVKDSIVWQLENLMVEGANYNRLNSLGENNRVTLRETSMQLAARAKDAWTETTLTRIRMRNGVTYDLKARAEFNYVVTDDGRILLLTTIEGYRNARAPYDKPIGTLEVGQVQIDVVRGKTGRR